MSKILNNNNFLLIINEISNRLNKLEEKNLELTKIIEDIQKNNINKSSKILDKIENKSTPSILYNDWIEHIFLLIPSKLEIVFKNDLLKGIYQLLKESIENFESIPICAYNKKKLVFYYYNKETEKWEILENKKFDELISRICYRFLIEFKRCWYNVNIENQIVAANFSKLLHSCLFNFPDERL